MFVKKLPVGIIGQNINMVDIKGNLMLFSYFLIIKIFLNKRIINKANNKKPIDQVSDKTSM